MTILLAWLLADFVSGLVHWWEDRALIGQSRFKFINGVRADNELHHTNPTAMLKFSWWGNLNTTAPFAWALALALYLAGAPSVVALAVFFLSFGNLIHRWSHEPKHKRPRIVTLLQKTGLFISPNHHARHHLNNRGRLIRREDSRIRYCVMSCWVNPILDRIGFFTLLERLLKN